MWGGFKPAAEFAAMSPFTFLIQYLYYSAEAFLLFLIIAHGQQGFVLVFKKHTLFPFGGILLAITWGLVHIFTQNFSTGIYAFVRHCFMDVSLLQLKRITGFLIWSSFLCSWYNIPQEGVWKLKVNEYPQPGLTENRIDFYYRTKNKEVCEILNYLKKHRQRLVGKTDDSQIIFSLDDVFYFESVDKKIFACLEHKVLQIDARLQDLEEAYFESGFIRVNKSTILNAYKIRSLKPELNMRVMAVLDNGEKIQINRSYKRKFNLFLNTMSKGGFHVKIINNTMLSLLSVSPTLSFPSPILSSKS